ncbi:dicarboxylate/amino acid:cation symporter [Deinococcus cellulosilyticus]|uniref:C4-dicarboxylate transport protein n=1 Tax=Deinococcus cellulosilyticus (strain DSM 18568 / NBRC 106333 / KACC 11606 / 5516J-15) TaxID=1223518 RepID=A0A511N066_DEIC1|nr:dicarboxylate/amino acid:cation symporter [Deinococcus cellulosilyticus]GEM46242.1 C4-dicarboxylate transport protein [Deinococcus cellulosilyticus NBRC 106333 = KACC 11606]
MRFIRTLYGQVILAIVLGILLGFFLPNLGASLKPLGDAFVRLVKMVITPIVFCTVVLGIAGMKDVKKVGRVGVKAILYFEVITTFALLIGLVVVNVLKPGAGMNVNAATLDTSSISKYTENDTAHQSIADFLINIIPNNPIDAFAQGNMLQVLFLAVVFSFAITQAGKYGEAFLGWLENVMQIFFKMVNSIMKFAPIGAFGAMAFTIGKYGVGSLASLGFLMVSFYLTCAVFVFVVLGLVARMYGFNLMKFLRYIRDELLLVLGTSSSESALPRLMRKMEHLGCSKSVVGLVVPTGYSFNLDGTSIYLTMAAVFIAQATNTHLDLTHQLTLLAVLLLTSKGAAGVTGSGFITLAATLTSLPAIPLAGLALIVGIDRFMSEARAIVNFIGNGVATLVISKWENEIDLERAKDVLDDKIPYTHHEPALDIKHT